MKKVVNCLIVICLLSLVVFKDVEASSKVSITLSFIGDITLGNYAGQGYSGSFNQEYVKQKKNTNYFLKKVKGTFLKDDLTIANLEGPLTTAKKHQKKRFAFKGLPNYVNILKNSSVEVVSLANNHSQDYYQKGFNDTKSILKKNKISYFGYSQTCIKTVKGIKIGFLGYAFPSSLTSSMKKSIKNLKKKTDIVIVYFHWGIERDKKPQSSQRKLAKQVLNCGVDLIVGSHPHVLQGIETYKGKKIVYSLGNFCFGGNKNPSDKDTMIYQHTFMLNNKKIVKQKCKIIPCMITSKKSRNNYQPTIVKGKDAKRVLKKVNKIK